MNFFLLFLREHQTYLRPSLLRAILLIGLLAPALNLGSNSHHLLGTMSVIPLVIAIGFMLGLIFGSSWPWKPHLWGFWLSLPLIGFLIVETVILRSEWFSYGWFILLVYIPALMAGTLGAGAGRKLAFNVALKAGIYRMSAVFAIMLAAISLGLSFQVKPPPISVVKEVVKFSARGDSNAVYNLLHSDLRTEVPFSEFRKIEIMPSNFPEQQTMKWTAMKNGTIAEVKPLDLLDRDIHFHFWLSLDGYEWKIVGYETKTVKAGPILIESD